MKKTIKITLIILFWLGIWEIFSLFVNNPLLFPSPIEVFKRMGQLLLLKDFYISAGNSLFHVLIALSLSTVIGVAFAVVCAKIPLLNDMIAPFMVMIKSTPVVSFICLITLFVNRNVLPIVICALMVIPVIFHNVYHGIQKREKELLEVCKIYRVSFSKKMRNFDIPSVFPYFLSAFVSSIGLGWKASIAAEVICIAPNSIGNQIFSSKQNLETVELFAWTAGVILLSLLLEFGVKKFLALLSKKGGTYENRN